MPVHTHNTGFTRLAMLTGAVACIFIFSSAAFAVDGVIEINQARALAGGVTPTDTPGFPVIIDTLGSYRLTSNLDVPAGFQGIEVTADHVTVDLNGFSVSGSATLSAFPIGVGQGLALANNTTVRNGVVRGFEIGVAVGPGSHVEGVHALNNDTGILTGTDCTVVGNRASGNSGRGINTGERTTVMGNTANNNPGDGIFANRANTVTGNTANSNGGIGINAQDSSTVIGNTMHGNTSFGLSAGAITGYAHNVITSNNGGNGNAQATVNASAIELDTNICGTDTTCPF